jgi:hypothetical protein
MSHFTALARLALLAVTLHLLAPDLRAYQFPFKGTIGSGVIGDPMDVAIYASEEHNGYAFVVGTSLSNKPTLFRFPITFTGAGAAAPSASYDVSAWKATPTAVAVNDLPGHCNRGQVYVTFPTLIAVYDLNGAPLMDLVWNDGAGGGFTSLTGIDVDNEGNVYVADHGRDRIVKFASSWFGLPHYVSKIGTEEIAFDAWGGGKCMDCSVDVCGRIHVTNDCNCYSVSDPDGTLWCNNGNSAVHLVGQQGVTALSPLEEAWLTSPDVYHFRWDPVATTDVQDYTTGTSILTNSRGIEYHKFLLSRGVIGGPSTGLQKSWERLYVADRGSACIEVFGEDHDSVKPDPSLQGFWHFDENHDNCHGTCLPIGNDVPGAPAGTAIGTPLPEVRKGVVDHSIRFTGGSSAVSVPDYAGIRMGTSGFTVEGWIRSEFNGGTRTVLDKRVGTGAGYTLYLWNGFLGVQLNDGSTFQNWASTLPQNMLADGEWHHFAVVIDPFTWVSPMISIYDDGVFTESQAVNSLLVTSSIASTANLIFGRENPNSASNGIRGNLDDIGIYQSNLSALQISGVYTAYVAGKRR